MIVRFVLIELIICVMKDDAKFNHQIFVEEALHCEYALKKR